MPTTTAQPGKRHTQSSGLQREVGNNRAHPAGHGGLLDAQRPESGVCTAACAGQIDAAASVAPPTLGVVLRKAPQLIALVLGLRLRLLCLRAKTGVLALQRPDALTQQGQVLAEHRRRCALVYQRLQLVEKGIQHYILQGFGWRHGSQEGGAA